MKLYLSGPMTGKPEHNYPAFAVAAKALRELGHEVISPAELGEEGHVPGDMAWEEYLARDLKGMLDCEGVVVLRGWGKSQGACLEVYVARALNKRVLDIETLLPVVIPWED